MSNSDDEQCGSTDTGDGEPCSLPACKSDGRCWHHTEAEEQKRGGRDNKLTKQREEQIAQAIENGRSLVSASRRAGVTPNTVYTWLNKGEDQEQGVYADFHDRLTRARGEGEEFYMNLALEMAKENGDHRFIASLMKQRYPDAWGDTETGVEAADITVESEVVEITEDMVNR